MAKDQKSYRFYEDGTEAGSVAIAAQDTNIIRTNDSDSNLLARFLIDVTGIPIDADPDPDWRLQYRVNSGSWTDVTGTSSVVKGFASTNLTDGGATTNRLTGGAGSFVAGEISEDGLVDGSDPLGGNHTEYLYAITLVAADTTNGDTIEFRVLSGGAPLDSYTIYATLSIGKSSTGTTSRLLLLGVGS